MTKEEFIKAITTFPFLTEEELEANNLIHTVTETKKNDIKSAFERYNIISECVALFGDWAVSEDNDIVNISPKCAYYPILSNNHVLKSENEIFDQLDGKDWFKNTPKQRSSLVDALSYREYKSK